MEGAAVEAGDFKSYKLKEVVMVKNILIGLVVAVLVVGVAVASIYNSIVTKHETITAKWAQVENQLQRRNDLIPNLVNTVKGYAEHEKTVFENVTKARSQWANASTVNEKVKAAGQVDAALARLLLVVENYPLLKADQTFLQLMDELSGTENRIAVERKRYNEAVQLLNTYIRTFFGRFFAAFAGVSSAEYYEIPEGEKEAPKVKF